MLEKFLHYIFKLPKEWIPTISMGAFIFAIFLLIVLLLLCIAIVNSKNLIINKIATIPKKEPKEEALEEDESFEPLPVLSGRLGEILALNGFIKIGKYTEAFLKCLEVIRTSTYNIMWRYKIPFYMVVGLEKSGKTTLLDNLRFEHLSAEYSNINGIWRLFKKGALFETPAIFDKKFWEFLADIFSFIRPRRPLDGIILTVPANLLLTDSQNIQKLSADLFEKFFHFQHNVNFRLPIYIVITKGDLIEGFTEFANLLPPNEKQQIFGWSCPHPISSSFSSAWVNEILETFSKGIRKSILNMTKNQPITECSKKAMLFEPSIKKLYESLAVYINTLFRAHDPKDGLLLRGVYLVGKQNNLSINSDILQPAALNPELFSNINVENNVLSYDGNMFFIQDLFGEKIFKEYNIAYPIDVNSIDINKAEYRNKIVAASSSVLITASWFYGNSNLKEEIYNTFYTLSAIRTSMVKIKKLERHAQSEENQRLIKLETVNLLHNMPDIGPLYLFSIFVPQSWFPELRQKLRNTLGLVFDSIIVKAMFIDLNHNTNNLVKNIFDNPDVSYKKSDLFDITTFESFKQLKDYASNVLLLEKLSHEYNIIRHIEDEKSVRDLTDSIFKGKFKISRGVSGRIPNRQLMPPSFNISIYKHHLEENLKKVCALFVRDTLDKNIEKILENIVKDIDRLDLASKDEREDYTSQNLIKTYKKILLLKEVLKNKNFAWISKDEFAPGDAYMELLEELNNSELISHDTIKEILNNSQSEFAAFKERLANFSSKLAGKILKADLQTVSDGVIAIQKEIEALIEQPFIILDPPRKLRTLIPDDKMIIWNIKILKEAAEMINKYYDFIGAEQKNIREKYFDMYKTVIRKCLKASVISMVSKAEKLEDIAVGSSLLLEESFSKQAENMKDVSLYVQKIMKLFTDLAKIDHVKDTTFADLIIAETTKFLTNIDAELSSQKLYEAGEAIFSEWDGSENPRYLSIGNPDELRMYLDNQFEKIKFLAKDLAAPVVETILLSNIKYRNNPVISKWKNIISCVDDYEQKKPGNSIAALETFVIETLSKTSFESIRNDVDIRNVANTRSDFFIAKRSDIARALLARAEIVKHKKALEGYTLIRNYFNENLSNKFPFSVNAIDNASINDIETFIDMYEENKVSALMDEVKNRENFNKDAFIFLDRIDDALELLKAWVEHVRTGNADGKKVVFKIEYRPNPVLEEATNAVLDRILSVNNKNISEGESFAFYNGEDVEVLFSWVSGASLAPNVNAAIKGAVLKSDETIFKTTGAWALFDLIEKHRIEKKAAVSNGVLLEFKIPIINKANGNKTTDSKLVLKITPLQKEGDKVANLTWPVFPKICPSLF